MTRSCLVLGATGLVGSKLTRLLRADRRYDKVFLAVRKTGGMTGGSVFEKVVDFERPDSFGEALASADIFSCLGTTIKKAGSQDAFRNVDFSHPVNVGKAARAAGARRYMLVSSVGANKNSRVFYSRIKGETEAALSDLGFPEGVAILRPSLLLGERKEPRKGERAAAMVMGMAKPLFVGPLERYRPIEADLVARALVAAAFASATGAPAPAQVYEGRSLFALAGTV